MRRRTASWYTAEAHARACFSGKERKFQRCPRGMFWGTLFALLGKPIFGKYAKDVLSNLEQLEKSNASESPAAG
jgi:hypothetical protein